MMAGQYTKKAPTSTIISIVNSIMPLRATLPRYMPVSSASPQPS